MQAYKAQIGSTSEIYTLEPYPLSAYAHPLPTSPKPHTKAFLPERITSVPLNKPSMTECLQP